MVDVTTAKQYDTSTPSGLLEAMADHIERVGLYQGGDYFDPRAPGKMGAVPCCVYGALRVLQPQVSAGADVVARATLAHRVGSIAPWSDGTPQSEVLATLRSVAADLREGGQ